MNGAPSRGPAGSRGAASTRAWALGWRLALLLAVATAGCRPDAVPAPDPATPPVVTEGAPSSEEGGATEAPAPTSPPPPAEEDAPAQESARDTLRVVLHDEPSKAHDDRARRAQGVTEEHRVLKVGEHLALLDREQLVVLRMDDVRERPDAIRLRAWSGRLPLRTGDAESVALLDLAPDDVIDQQSERLTLGGLPFRWSLALAHESAWLYYPETGDVLMGRLRPCPDDASGASLCGLVRRGTGRRARWLSGVAERDALPWSVELTDDVLAHWRASLDVARRSSWRRSPRNHVVCRNGNPVLVFREGVLGLFRLVPSETDPREASLEWRTLSSDGTVTLDSGQATSPASEDDGIAFGPFELTWFPRRDGRFALSYAPGCGTWVAPVPEERAKDLDVAAEMQRARLFAD